MLIEKSAYCNRWRPVAPAAKGVFALCGLTAAFLAARPLAALAVALLMVTATIAGARVSPAHYVRAALPPLGFLVAGSLSLAVSIDVSGEHIAWYWLPGGWSPVATLGARALGALASLLFLAMTTPMNDLIAALRRLGLPEVLLEIMTLCYRLLFVLSAALHDIRTAQAARLGYATPRLAFRSLGQLTAALTLQVWSRARDLDIAARARNNDGPLRFLETRPHHAGRDLGWALAGGALLILFAAGMR